MPSARTYFTRAKQLVTLAFVPDKTYQQYVIGVSAQKQGKELVKHVAKGVEKDVLELAVNPARATWYLALAGIEKTKEIINK